MSDGLVKVFVDVLSALHAQSLEGNIFGFDTNLASGSTGLGGPSLSTAVEPGDHLIWTAIPLECEAPVTLTGVEFTRPEFVPVLRKRAGVTTIRLIVPEFDTVEPYTLTFAFGRHGKVMHFTSGFTIRPIEAHHD